MGQVTKLVPIRSIMTVQRNRSKVLATLAVCAVLCALNSMSSSAWVYNLHQRNPAISLKYWADAGYFADGTSIIKAGNACNHGPPTVPDPHVNGSPLPASKYAIEVGYFVDGTSYVTAGNSCNHGPSTAPDPHVNGSPLPPSEYVADIGYFVDGTDITKAGNALNHARGANAAIW